MNATTRSALPAEAFRALAAFLLDAFNANELERLAAEIDRRITLAIPIGLSTEGFCHAFIVACEHRGAIDREFFAAMERRRPRRRAEIARLCLSCGLPCAPESPAPSTSATRGNNRKRTPILTSILLIPCVDAGIHGAAPPETVTVNDLAEPGPNHPDNDVSWGAPADHDRICAPGDARLALSADQGPKSPIPEIVETDAARDAIEAAVRALLREKRTSIRSCVNKHAKEIGFIIGAQDVDDVRIQVRATAKQWKVDVYFSPTIRGPQTSACIRTKIVSRLNNIAPPGEIEGLIVWRSRSR